jgi:hypothetical protein
MKGLPGFAVLFVIVGIGWTAAAADNRPIQDFYGEYVGKSIAGTVSAAGDDAEITPRLLNVSIQPNGDGFTLVWLTITTGPNGNTKAKSHLVDFRPTARPGLFASAMRRDVNGNLVPLDPMSGDPYTWARIAGDTLTVHALLVTDDGGYEVQVYDRTLTNDGMDLTFQRFRDGVLMKEIVGKLARVED